MRTTLAVLLLLLQCPDIHGQLLANPSYPPKPQEGDEMPNIQLENVTHYPKRTIKIADFRGKWVILYFWISYCPTCTNSFAKMNALQKKYKDKVQLIMVGNYGRMSDTFESTKSLYERMREKLNLDLVVAYDSGLLNHWGIKSVPRIFIIDDRGFVQVADGQVLDEQKLEALLNGEKTSFRLTTAAPEYRPDKLFRLEASEIDSILIFGSVISRNRNESTWYPPLEFEKQSGKCVFKIQAASLTTLYKYAYLGKYGWYGRNDPLYGQVFPEPVLELADSSQFSYTYLPDVGYSGLYNYSIHATQCDDRSGPDIMKILQSDLEKSFGYRVTFETRQMPCWRLTTTSPRRVKKLESKGGESEIPMATAAGFTLKNATVSTLLSIIAAHYGGKDNRPFFDDTGIKGNIDISIDALMSDPKALIRSLNDNGLDLISDKKEMQVLVIKDPAEND